MYPIWKYGNEERMKYLPKLATGESWVVLV
jgi:hypothetical protein